MNKETKIALEGSIKKWQKIYDFLKNRKRITKGLVDTLDILEQGYENCPLCQKYRYCIGCPISTKTNDGGCGSTPYMKFSELHTSTSFYSNWDNEHLNLLKQYALDELNFLKSLREK